MDGGFRMDSSVGWEMRRKASFSKLAEASRGQPGQYDGRAGGANQAALFELMATYLPNDVPSIQKSVVNHVEYTLAKTRFNMDAESCYRACAFSVRDRLIESFNDTSQYFNEKKAKRVYYLSLEFLLGRALQNALVNLDVEAVYREALSALGYDLEALYSHERDPALGNGGLGRLAACFLDSIACLNLAGWGYGIRYTYGIFEQKVVDGAQVEYPDYWLLLSNPWEIERTDCTYAVRFYGQVRAADGHHKWRGGQLVQAVAYDNPLPGFDTYNTINLRLWKAAPAREFDFQLFNSGQYLESVRDRQSAEYITAVLYPNDNAAAGKELRLKQQYFFVCATVQDVLRRFRKRGGAYADLPDAMALQLNDTHPTIAIPELLRILIDAENLGWTEAWAITKRCFHYTNHTVLPEALEVWPVGLIERLLPRHLQLINEINHTFLTEVREAMPDRGDLLAAMSIYQEGEEQKIRMANLAVIGSAHVNGVAAIHSELVKSDLFPHFVEYFHNVKKTPKFLNVTNGVTPRRWIHCANPWLSALLSKHVGSDSWLKDLDMLKALSSRAEEPALQKEWREVKRQCKERLARWVRERCGVHLDAEWLFDIQVKRIHEYKRQLMFAFFILHRYLVLKGMNADQKRSVQKRVCFLGGKAAPGYYTAKLIIKLFNAISFHLNNDPDTNTHLKAVFLPNYNVSSAQIIIPASDLSEHISTAGTEASGTSNMKFVMNGGLIVGTLDGANVEIREECGNDTMFIFGAQVEQIEGLRRDGREGRGRTDGRLDAVFDLLRRNGARMHEPDHAALCALLDNLRAPGGDFYLLAHDFGDYVRAQEEADRAYADQTRWTRLSIQATTRMGKFTSDRSIRDYANNIWQVTPCERPAPSDSLITSQAPTRITQPKITPPADIKKITY